MLIDSIVINKKYYQKYYARFVNMFKKFITCADILIVLELVVLYLQHSQHYEVLLQCRSSFTYALCFEFVLL